MTGYIAIVKDDFLDDEKQAYFYESEKLAVREEGEMLIKVEPVNSIVDIGRVLCEHGFDGEYIGFFIEQDVQSNYLLSWSE